MAQACGAVRVKDTLRDLIVREGGVKLLLARGRIIRSKAVIGADGTTSLVANRSRLPPSLDSLAS